MREYTPEELGLTKPTAQKEYTPQELGLVPTQKEYTPEELGLAPSAKPVEEPKKNEKPSLLAGTTLPPDIGPMGNRDITEVGTALPGTRELPKIDASKIPREWGVGETLLQSAKVGIPQLLQGFSTTGFRVNADTINKIDAVEQQIAAGKKNFTIEASRNSC